MSTANKLSYLNDTKSLLRTSLNKFGSNILTTDTFKSYDTKLNDIYDKLPKVTQSGAGFTLSDVQNGQVDDFKMIGTDLYQNQLPSEYTAIEYLQSDNECFIDTGINADYKLSLKMKVACLDSVLEYMGAIKNIDNTNYIRHHLAFAPTAGNIIGIYYGQTNDQLILKEFDNNFHEFNLDIYNKKVSIDNNSTISISYNNFDVGINYYLFARNGSNIAISKGSYKIAYCKMYYEDNLVRDFAPCYRNSDNVAGLYDFVTNTFFTNQGTGTFTVGNNITLPNPDYPQEIKVVEGRQVITDKGKNLLNISKNVNGYWYKNGVLTANADWSYINDFIEVKASTQYTISRDSSELNESQFSIEEFDENKNYIKQNVLWQNNTNKYSITTDSNTKYVICNYRNEYAHTDLQFESGDNRTDYEPYYEPVSYNIDLLGKNIFDGQYEDGYYNMNGTKPTTQDTYGRRSTNLNEIKPNTNYIISINNNIISEAIRVFYYDASRKFISTESISNGTFTTPAECYYVSWHSSSLKQNYPDGIPNMMIEQGQTVTTYEDYYNYKLAKMPNTNYKNKIYKNNGNWYFEENVKKIVVDEKTSTPSINSSSNNTIRLLYSQLLSNNKSIADNPDIVSNYLTGKIMWNIDSEGIYSNKNDLVMRMNKSTVGDTLNSVLDWLSTHNVEVWYPLATPVTTQITNATLINQLESLYLHTGTNIITISNDNNIIPEIEITRLKELEKLA